MKKVPAHPKFRQVTRFAAAMQFIAGGMTAKELRRALLEVSYLEANGDGPWLEYHLRAQIAELCRPLLARHDRRRKQLPLL